MNRFKTDDEIREFAKKINTDAYRFIAIKDNKQITTIVFFCCSETMAYEECIGLFKREYSYCDTYDMVKL